jgi:hypothetical protein
MPVVVVSMPLRLRRRLWSRGDVSRWFGEGGGACRRRRGWRWLAEVVVEVAPGWRPVDQALDRPVRSTARLTGFWPGWRPVGARFAPGWRPVWRPVDRPWCQAVRSLARLAPGRPDFAGHSFSLSCS